jgi:hypothetical protein
MQRVPPKSATTLSCPFSRLLLRWSFTARAGASCQSLIVPTCAGRILLQRVAERLRWRLSYRAWRTASTMSDMKTFSS